MYEQNKGKTADSREAYEKPEFKALELDRVIRGVKGSLPDGDGTFYELPGG